MLYSETEHEVGCPLPPHTPHAVSVSLPTWSANIAYEEAHPNILAKMQTGYPRFVIHNSIKKLSALCERKFARPFEACMLFSSKRVAERCREFISNKLDAKLIASPRIVEFVVVPGEEFTNSTSRNATADERVRRLGPIVVTLHIVLFPRDVAAKIAKQFWQHTGEGVSSRLAEHSLRLLTALEGERDGGAVSTRTRDGRQAEEVEVKEMDESMYPKNTASRNRYTQKPFGRSSGTRRYDVTKEGESETGLYVEERYGRNLDFRSADDAKIAIRRRIAAALRGDVQSSPDPSEESASKFEERSSSLSSLTEDDVYLYPCGMSAIFNTHRTLMKVFGNNKKSVQFGFPYIDTLKILQKFGPGCHFLGHGDDADIERLEQILSDQTESSSSSSSSSKILALFCEFPSNPLLRSPDLRRLRKLADEHDFLIVVDETVGNFLDVQVLEHADVVVSSLTKVFSGDSNVMSGSAVLNPNGKHYTTLKEIWKTEYEDNLWCEDAIFLERNSRTFRERIDRIDANAELIADYLMAHPKVKRIYYPKFTTPEIYTSHRRTRPRNRNSGGYGGLFSVLLETEQGSSRFFDALSVSKGPSLGTNFTLACPYTILAHYEELDWAKSFGVEKHLIRVSVGMEEGEELKERFRRALEVV